MQGAAETALGVLFLKHGRDDELQADQLGVDYTAQDRMESCGRRRNADDALAAGRGERQPPGRAELAVHASGAGRSRRASAGVHPESARSRSARRATTDETISSAMSTASSTATVRATASSAAISSCTRTSGSRSRFRGMGNPEQRQSRSWRRRRSATTTCCCSSCRMRRGSVDQIAQTGMASAGFRQLNGQRSQINGMDAYVGTYQGNLEGLGNVVTSAAHIVHEKNVYLLAGFAPPNQFDSRAAGVCREHPFVQGAEPRGSGGHSSQSRGRLHRARAAIPGSRSRSAPATARSSRRRWRS